VPTPPVAPAAIKPAAQVATLPDDAALNDIPDLFHMDAIKKAA
jgi:hypothetical protein